MQRQRGRGWLLPALWFVAGACGDSTGVNGGGGGGGGAPLPDFFRVFGDATGAGTVAGQTIRVECSLDWLVDLTVPAPGETEPGRFGGEVARSVLRSDSSGFAIFADAAGAIDTLMFPPDSVELVFPANRNTGSAFWDSLGVLRGHLGGATIASGTWVCAPLDREEEEFGAAGLTVIGSWHAEPRAEQP